MYTMGPNPKAADYRQGSEERMKLEEFNRTYGNLLNTLHDSFNGKPELLMNAVGGMYELKYQAVALMKIPSGDGKTTLGPSFEYVPKAR